MELIVVGDFQPFNSVVRTQLQDFGYILTMCMYISEQILANFYEYMHHANLQNCMPHVCNMQLCITM